MSIPSDELSPTSYALLGLLALQPWTTYELAKQMQRSVRWFWPRAERKIYDEPKRLVALGLATARTEMTGRRPSTVYEITPAGREALRAWVPDTGFAPPTVEIEAMVHLFFAEHATPSQLVAVLERTRRQCDEAIAALADMAEGSLAGDAFPERRAMNALDMELYVRLHETIREWTTWAEQEVASWPPVRRQRRAVVAGPPERGTELYAAIAARRPPLPESGVTEADPEEGS